MSYPDNNGITPAIAQLAASSQLWAMPPLLTHDDPSWATCWVQADTVGKTNLARAWLWTIVSHFQRTGSTNPTNDFLLYLNNHLPWAQTIQPYLDETFFSPQVPGSPWNELAGLLVANVPAADNELAWLKTFFFGKQHEKEAVLYAGITDSQIKYLFSTLGPALLHNTCAIVNASSRSDTLLRAACHFSYIAGSQNSAVVEHLPTSMETWFALGYHRNCPATEHSHELPGLEIVRLRASSLPASLVASLLLPILRVDCCTVTNGDELMRSDSVLINHVYDIEPFAVVSRWIPTKSTWLAHAKSLGVSCVAACEMIAADMTPASGVTNELPADMAVTF